MKLGSDYAVPLRAQSRDAGRIITRRCMQQDLDYVIFGHIGDAHVHVNILPRSPAEFEAGQR